MKLQVINRHDIDKDSRCRVGKAKRVLADDDQQLYFPIRDAVCPELPWVYARSQAPAWERA